MKTLLDSLANWIGDSAIKGAKALKDAVILSSLEREFDARKKKRDSLVMMIHQAQEKGDHEKLQELYIALHLLDSDK